MSVIQTVVSRFATWLVGVLLLLAGGLLRVWLVATNALAGFLGSWSQQVETRRATVALAAARKAKAANRWRTTFEAAPLGMAKVTLEGRLEDFNSAFRSLLGQPKRAVLGRRLTAFVYPDDLPAMKGPGNPGNSPRGVAKAEVRLVCAGGVLRWCELASSVVRDAHDRPEYVLVSVVDITRHKRSQAALRDLATRDPLSGLANRRWFELQLAQHLRLCVDDGPRGALIVVDLDRFKEVNDTHGHQAGDRLVVEVAVTLRRHLRDRDVVARLGGDEFAVILSEGDRGAAEAVARKLVLAVRDEVGLPMSDAGASLDLTGASNDLSGGSSGPDGACSRPDQAPTMAPGSDRTGPRVTVSVGVAAFEVLAEISHLGASTAARDAVKAADAAMYSVKHSGRNGYAVAGTGEGPHHARPRPPSAPEFSAGPRGLERAPTRLSVAVPAAGAR